MGTQRRRHACVRAGILGGCKQLHTSQKPTVTAAATTSLTASVPKDSDTVLAQ
jgi:hypothetical protein